MVHVIDITYVARSLMKASQHNSGPLKACTCCCTVHHYLFQEKERKIKPFTKHKHLLVFIDLHFQFFSKILMFSVDLLFMFLGYNLENEEIL